MSAAQPSATTAARIERRSGSHTCPKLIAGPQCSRVRPATPGTACATVDTSTSCGTPESSRRTTSALAASTAQGHPAQRRRRGTALGLPGQHDLPRVEHLGQVDTGQGPGLPGVFAGGLIDHLTRFCGMSTRRAGELYDVPILGGHLTLHDGEPAVSAFGVGVTSGQALSVTRVRAGQSLLVTAALDGRMRPDFPFFPAFEER
jgi:hypothetical protein